MLRLTEESDLATSHHILDAEDAVAYLLPGVSLLV